MSTPDLTIDVCYVQHYGSLFWSCNAIKASSVPRGRGLGRDAQNYKGILLDLASQLSQGGSLDIKDMFIPSPHLRNSSHHRFPFPFE
jgi:hypothetical protein